MAAGLTSGARRAERSDAKAGSAVLFSAAAPEPAVWTAGRKGHSGCLPLSVSRFRGRTTEFKAQSRHQPAWRNVCSGASSDQRRTTRLGRCRSAAQRRIKVDSGPTASEQTEGQSGPARYGEFWRERTDRYGASRTAKPTFATDECRPGRFTFERIMTFPRLHSLKVTPDPRQ